MHFLRKAQEIYKVRLPKELSPSFWDSEGISAADSPWFDAIMSGIEHPLGVDFPQPIASRADDFGN